MSEMSLLPCAMNTICETLSCWAAGKLSEDEIRAVIRSEISKATASRPHFERIAAFTLLKEPLSPENGTLTRTFKPRRAAIYEKYAKEVAEVQGKLRRV